MGYTPSMTDTEALETLKHLAAGTDPKSGEALPAESVFNQVEVVRALQRAIDRLAEPVKPPKPKPARAGEPWTAEEDAKLCQLWDSGLTAKALSDEHGRTKGAIESRLVRLGKMN